MMEVDLKTKFDQIPVGSRINIADQTSTFNGFLESVDGDGVWLTWREFEFNKVNGKMIEDFSERHQFIPFDQIKTFGWTR